MIKFNGFEIIVYPDEDDLLDSTEDDWRGPGKCVLVLTNMKMLDGIAALLPRSAGMSFKLDLNGLFAWIVEAGDPEIITPWSAYLRAAADSLEEKIREDDS